MTLEELKKEAINYLSKVFKDDNVRPPHVVTAAVMVLTVQEPKEDK